MKQLEMEADCLGSKQKEQSAWGDVLQCFEEIKYSIIHPTSTQEVKPD